MTDSPVLAVDGLTIEYRTRNGVRTGVEDAGFEVLPGEVLAVVGESGSGKSTTAHALLGLLPDNASVVGGSVRYRDRELVGLRAALFRDLRGRAIALVPQDPTVSLDPVRRIGAQIEDVLELHTDLTRPTRRERVHELLRLVGFTDVERRARQFPHELSGGMRQRVLIAAAIACEPDVIVADEPTSGLDATVQAQVLDLLDELRRRIGTSVVIVTHDLGVAADRSDRIAVMQAGRLVEHGPTADVLREPQHAYTRHLLGSVPSRLELGHRDERRTVGAADEDPGSAAPADGPAVEVRDLVRVFPVPCSREGFRAVDGISFTVDAGQTLSIVGESGSGKSTTARLLARLDEPTAGSVLLDGADVTDLDAAGFRPLRRRIQFVQQNPYASFDPRWDVARVVGEPLRSLGGLGGRRARTEREDRTVRALERAALPADFLHRHPRELSGGQRQRVAIARALVLEPSVVVLDEPISALDVSVQAQILELLQQLQDDLGLTYVFISHDLAVVRAISDQVVVMRGGRALEQGPAAEVFAAPRHEYTRQLLDSVAGARLPV